MSLSFPTSPTNGQIYQNWVWSSSVGAWQPNYAAGFVQSVDGMSGTVSLKGRLTELSRSVVTLGSPVASVAFDGFFSAAYDEYELHAYGVSPTATGGASAGVQLAVSGVYDTAAINYSSVIWSNFTDGTVQSQTAFSNTASGIIMTAGQVNNANPGVADRWAQIIAKFALPLHPTARKYLFADSVLPVSAGTVIRNISAGYYGTTNTALSGIRFYYGNGQVAQGNFVLYGRNK